MARSDVVILRELLRADGEFVSGNDLAATLGISRVGVWARLEKFKESGFKFEAVRHRGYLLKSEPKRLCEPLLLAYLSLYSDQSPPVVFLDEVDSTNSEAERQLASGKEAPFVVVASQQTRGRGRLGRRWHSPDLGNLYASFAFRPEVPHSHMQTITIWLGVLVCELLRREAGLDVKIKWPNDLHVEGRKIAGMLTEARIDADRTRDLVYGLGLNVLGDLKQWPDEVQAVATTVSAHATKSFSFHALTARIILTVTEGYASYIRGEYKEELERLWPLHDALIGREIEANWRGKPLRGVAQGIDGVGALCVELPDGETVHLHSGEVSLGSKDKADFGQSRPTAS